MLDGLQTCGLDMYTVTNWTWNYIGLLPVPAMREAGHGCIKLLATSVVLYVCIASQHLSWVNPVSSPLTARPCSFFVLLVWTPGHCTNQVLSLVFIGPSETAVFGLHCGNVYSGSSPHQTLWEVSRPLWEVASMPLFANRLSLYLSGECTSLLCVVPQNFEVPW